jgi:hypothetical protein
MSKAKFPSDAKVTILHETTFETSKDLSDAQGQTIAEKGSLNIYEFVNAPDTQQIFVTANTPEEASAFLNEMTRLSSTPRQLLAYPDWLNNL